MNIHSPISAEALDLIRKVGLAAFAFAFSTFGTTHAQSSDQTGTFHPSFEITTKQDGGKVTVSGKTNLPEQTKVNLLLSTEIEGERISCEDMPIVQNGGFTSRVLESQAGGPLPSGTYRLETRVRPLEQPAGLAELIGERGKNLTGPFVTTTKGRKFIKFDREVIVQGEASDSLRQKLETALGASKRGLLALRNELDSFKSHPDFHRYGFAPAGYEEWADKVKGIQEKDESSTRIYRAASTVLMQLGFEYLRSKGAENDSTRFYRKELNQYLGEKE